MDWSTVPVLKYVWAWWRIREARLRDSELELPPVMRRFAVGEIVPLKGVAFRVAHIGAHGIVIAPTGFTGGERRRLAAIIERERHVQKASRGESAR